MIKCAHSPLNLRIKGPVYTHDGASAKLSTYCTHTKRITVYLFKQIGKLLGHFTFKTASASLQIILHSLCCVLEEDVKRFENALSYWYLNIFKEAVTWMKAEHFPVLWTRIHWSGSWSSISNELGSGYGYGYGSGSIERTPLNPDPIQSGSGYWSESITLLFTKPWILLYVGPHRTWQHCTCMGGPWMRTLRSLCLPPLWGAC
jgi:hypothetical protein